MNDVDRVEEMVRKGSTVRGGWWKRHWQRFVRHLGRTPTMKGLYIGAVFVLIGFQFVLFQFGTINARNRIADRQFASQQVYVAQILAYGQGVNAYQICLDGVTRSDQNRAQWIQLADIVEALDTGNGKAVTFGHQIRTGPLLSAPPRATEDCINPGPPPPPPK